jgi:hypothetical protein
MGAHALSENLAAGLLFFTSSLAASLVLYLWSRPRAAELGGTGVVALAGSLLLGLPGPVYAKAMVFMAYWAASAFLYVFAAAAVSKEHLKRVPLLVSMIVPPAFTIGTLPLLRIMSLLTPATLDYHLYAFDASFGFQPGFLAGRIVQGTGWLRVLCEACYISLPAATTILYCLERRRDPAAAQRLFCLVVMLAVVGFAGYYFFPGVGSVVAFGPQFPDNPPAVKDVAVVQVYPPDHPRNCMPSLHTACALAIWWCSLRLSSRTAKILLGTYVFFTLLYTLSCGHYLADMVVAVPFTALMYLITAVRAARPLACQMGLCAAVVVLWFVFVRFGEPVYGVSRMVPWALTLATCAGTGMVLRTAMKAEAASSATDARDAEPARTCPALVN